MKLFKPYNLLFYLLNSIAFFFVGVSYAGYIEAAKNQMLAGGAIVFGYGVVAAFIAFIISLFIAFKANKKLIFRLNIVLTLVIVLFLGYYYLKYQKRQKAKELEQEQFKKPSKAVTPDNKLILVSSLTPKNRVSISLENDLGLGIFIPNFYKNKSLYFYGNLTPGKSVQEHTPIDSITFKQRESGGFDILTAPPWLVPEHLKLDYDILYFKVTSISYDFIEVVVNTTNDRTAFVGRYAGKILYWPEFLLSVHSIEFSKESNYKVYSKPFKNAGIITVNYSIMKPLKIKSNWMYVELQNNSFEKVGNGWVLWKKDNKLLIKYSMLS